MPGKPGIQPVRHCLEGKNFASQTGGLNFAGKPRRPGFRKIWVRSKQLQKARSGDPAHRCVQPGDRVAVIRLGEGRGFSHDGAGEGTLEDERVTRCLVANKLNLTRRYQKQTFHLFSLVEKIRSRREPTLKSSGRSEE